MAKQDFTYQVKNLTHRPKAISQEDGQPDVEKFEHEVRSLLRLPIQNTKKEQQAENTIIGPETKKSLEAVAFIKEVYQTVKNAQEVESFEKEVRARLGIEKS